MTTKKLAFLGLTAAMVLYLADQALGIAWTWFVAEHMTFHRYWGFVDSLYPFLWLPSVVLYMSAGAAVAHHGRRIGGNMIWLLAVAALALELLLVHHYFSDEADIVSRSWGIAGYAVPSLSLLAGYFAFRWLRARTWWSRFGRTNTS